MKFKLIILLVFLIGTTGLFAQTQLIKSDSMPSQKHDIISQNYQLFPTQNMWTFIKLDTRNGKMWQVQYSVGEEAHRMETVLNSTPLAYGDKELKGRFTLYPTKNIYNFILLDQIDGAVYQVQWSQKEENRVVVPIN